MKTEHAREQTYRDIEKMLFSMSWWATEHFGGEWCDWLSVVHLAYQKAYDTYNPVKGAKYSTWVWHCVRGAILEERGRLERERQHVTYTSRVPDMPGHHQFDLRAFLFELSDDAQVIACLAVSLPGDLAELVEFDAKGKVWFSEEGLGAVRRAIWRSVRGCGWTMNRCVGAFHELREALR